MYKMKIKIFSLLILFFISGNIFKSISQCSDAGVCSIGHLADDTNNKLISITAAYKFGSSGKEDDVKYHSFQLGAVYNVLEKTSLQFSIPYNLQTGSLGDVNGIGDLSVGVTQNLFSNENSMLDASIGAKFATGDDNKDNLPMAYQSGLGSNDFIFALNYSYNQIGFGVGYQLAGGRNENTLTKLKRGDDLLLRASYNFLIDQFTIKPQILFIKRFSESSIVNSASMTPMETYIDVEKSDQTQVNLLTEVHYEINKNYSLFVDVAVPFIRREVNVDGLTRSFSAALGVIFSIT